jgi:hypothetical protein
LQVVEVLLAAAAAVVVVVAESYLQIKLDSHESNFTELLRDFLKASGIEDEDEEIWCLPQAG